MKLGIEGNEMASGMHGHQCAQIRIRIQAQARNLIVRVGGTTRTTDDGFQDSWDHVTDGRQDQVQVLEVSRSITIVRVTYYENDGFWDRHHLRSQVMFRVTKSGFMTGSLVCERV